MISLDTPKYLYHYTTIETLALILKYKSIRFNSLANVDDLEEQESADLSNFGKFCFASCWTADAKENIALWNMYSKNGTGIRIKLPSNLFKKNNTISINWALLGNIKSLLCTFQNEWRFSFCTIPSQIALLPQLGFNPERIKHFCEALNPPFEYYDISIDDNAFSEMEILMGPSTTESDSTIVHSLIHTFNPTAQITLSSLKNTVKFKH